MIGFAFRMMLFFFGLMFFIFLLPGLGLVFAILAFPLIIFFALAG